MFKGKNAPSCGALVLAAGSGRRMKLDEKGGENINKVFLQLGDMPVLAHTLTAFEKCRVIDKIVIAARECDIELCRQAAEEFGITKLCSIVCGGEERQQSVQKGLATLADMCEFVAVHDGARCLVEPDDIERVVREAYECGAASLAIECSDTLKRADKDMYISEDVERRNTYRMQTPQVFRIDEITEAHKKAAEDNFSATDDCAVATHAGYKVKLVEGSALNIKLTTQDDLEIISAIIAQRKR